jgi:hypothetical protein
MLHDLQSQKKFMDDHEILNLPGIPPDARILFRNASTASCVVGGASHVWKVYDVHTLRRKKSYRNSEGRMIVSTQLDDVLNELDILRV